MRFCSARDRSQAIEKDILEGQQGKSDQPVREILRELNLPDELLEDAIAQLHRREVLAQRQKRNRSLGIAIAGVAIA